MDLSIIIVNWNSVKYLIECLESIKHLESISHEIIVVDNASFDGSEHVLRKEYPDVVFIQSDRNIGFAKANNLGIRRSSGRNLLFLNPDTEIIGGAIHAMLSNLDMLQDAGAIGCKLLNTDFTLQTSSIQPFPTILNQLLDIEHIKMKTKNLKMWGIWPMFSNCKNPVEVDVISGACLMVKKNVLEKIGCFSEDYFMYAEDIDLCYKIIKADYKNYYYGEVSVVHHGGGSSKGNDQTHFSAALMREAVFSFLNKTRGKVIALSYRFSTMISALIRIFIIKCALIILIENKFIYSLKKWERIFGWSIGLEKRKMELISNQK